MSSVLSITETLGKDSTNGKVFNISHTLETEYTTEVLNEEKNKIDSHFNDSNKDQITEND